MMVRISETNFYLREVPYNDQRKRRLAISLDYEKLVTHARHNHYCISFLSCPYQLNSHTLLTHFEWFSRYLYFNFEQSVLLFDIFPKLNELSVQQVSYLRDLLQQFPQAYQYDLNNSDHRQKWALLKNSKFQRYEDFLRIREADKEQRRLFCERLLILSENKEVEPEKVPEEAPTPPAKRREREASLYTYLKLSDDIPAEAAHEVISFLHEYLEPGFRRPYTLEEFSTIFTNENSPVLELKKGRNLDNQRYNVLFQELKNSGTLVVSWPVIERKVRVFKTDGTEYAGFSDIRSNKIPPLKANGVKAKIAPLIKQVDKHLLATRRK